MKHVVLYILYSGQYFDFPDPPCQPGQIFLVQNGLYRCPTYSTTCFMLNSHLWGVFLALWSHFVQYPTRPDTEKPYPLGTAPQSSCASLNPDQLDIGTSSLTYQVRLVLLNWKFHKTQAVGGGKSILSLVHKIGGPVEKTLCTNDTIFLYLFWQWFLTIPYILDLQP